MTESHLGDFAVGETLSRRSVVAGATFFGAAMAAIGEVAKAEGAGSGSYSNAAIALPPTAASLRKSARSKSAPSGSHARCARGLR
jgi:hypothetical protein